jgi:hypothetical protein
MRRTNLVAHHRQELGLGFVCAIGLDDRILQPRRQRLKFRRVRRALFLPVLERARNPLSLRNRRQNHQRDNCAEQVLEQTEIPGVRYLALEMPALNFADGLGG